jgi:hypothetical protein
MIQSALILPLLAVIPDSYFIESHPTQVIFPIQSAQHPRTDRLEFENASAGGTSCDHIAGSYEKGFGIRSKLTTVTDGHRTKTKAVRTWPWGPVRVGAEVMWARKSGLLDACLPTTSCASLLAFDAA